jgi:outer membrane scaffolding protein for murein synthesis (MipA/OmpV family)
MRNSKLALALSAALAAMAAPAVAQDGPGISAASGPGIGVTFGLGASIKPDYFGSDDYGIGPSANARIDYIRLPGGFEIGTGRAAGFVEGFGLRGSARYLGKRDDDDNSELDGMDDVDATLELGLGLGYDTANWRAYGVARYGFFGHEAFVGQIGADAIYRPTEQLIVNIGPRFDFGTGKFMETYFGVTAEEAQDSQFAEYDASGGLYSVGIELRARYQFTDAWGVEGTARYGRLVNDAYDSPIVEEGSPDQFGFGLLLTRSISMDF